MGLGMVVVVVGSCSRSGSRGVWTDRDRNIYCLLSGAQVLESSSTNVDILELVAGVTLLEAPLAMTGLAGSPVMPLGLAGCH